MAQVNFSATAYGANQSPNSVVTGDFDHDGRPDFAVMEAGNQLTIFRNTGSGAFTQKAQYAIVTNDNNTRIDTADMNGDGFLDIVIGKQFIPEFEIWYGNGDGTFRFGKDVPINSGDSLNFALGDVNRDGKVDFLYQYNDDSSSFVSVYLNDGAANFTSVGGPVFPTFVDNWALADFDRDGKLDVLVRMGSTLQEYSGDGTGQFTLHQTSTVNGGTGTMTVGSFNHDAVPDIALLIRTCDAGSCTSSTNDKAYVYLNDGTGHFGLRSSYTAGVGFGDITAGDLNGDTIGDIIAVGVDSLNGNAVPLQYLLNQGTGFFDGPYSAGSYSRQGVPAVRDLNLDGRHDVVFPAGSTYTLLNQNSAVACAPPSSGALHARICGPANNATVSRTFTVTGSGNSPAGVSRLEFWVDGKKSNEVLNDQIKQTITVSAARHRIAVVAVDRFGKTVTTAVSVLAH